jgi:hypothetical protein
MEWMEIEHFFSPVYVYIELVDDKHELREFDNMLDVLPRTKCRSRYSKT